MIEKAIQESARARSRRTKGSILQDPTLHLVAYVPPDHSGSITIDMTGMSGLTRARWFDPTTADYTDTAGVPLPGTQMQVFTPPLVGIRTPDVDDWVLLLEKQ